MAEHEEIPGGTPSALRLQEPPRRISPRRREGTAGRPRLLGRLHARLDYLYNGSGTVPERWRYGLVLFDIVTIAIFVIDSLRPPMPSMLQLDITIAIFLILDFSARLFIAERKLRHLLDPVTFADLVVITTLLLPFLIDNWAFLRVLRSLRLLRSYQLLKDLRRRFYFFRRNQYIIQAVVNLIVFIFVMTALVFVTQFGHSPQITTYIDALYFTVTTLTTTGFGDIVLQGEYGRLLAVLIMLIGFALFVRLVQAVFRPQKVEFRCPDCGLKRHESDAVHCKHCGRVLNIDSEGD
jgi:voltage-gated potassium channel